jgi:hypothetical protein
LEEKNGTEEDMQKNPTKYYHLIGSVEQMEQGGFRAKFCIIIIFCYVGIEAVLIQGEIQKRKKQTVELDT